MVAGLAEHTRARLASSWTVCESGTAGPTGGTSRNRTPGYVAVAVAGEGRETVTWEGETGTADREANMVLFAREALRVVRDVLRGEGEGKL